MHILPGCLSSKSIIIFFLFSFAGDQPGADVGPLITPAAKERCEYLIQSGIDQGANVSVGIFKLLRQNYCL